ncbi:MAG: DeoR/GlpR family DNA-binding transcription regulator [Solibacillus sp.]
MKTAKEQRLELIEQMVHQEMKVSVRALAKQLNLTPETIRKDLKELEAMKRVTRYHGGARVYEPTYKEPKFILKMNLHEVEKREIAKEAASRIASGDTVYIDVGSTTVHMASFIQGENIKVITNSLAAANAFSRALERHQFSGEVICVGGIVNTEQQSLVGSLTTEWLRQFHVQKAFISCGGVTQQAVYDYDMNEAALSHVMLESSDRVILLVDHTKLRKKSFAKIGGLKYFDEIISTAQSPWEEWQSIWTKVGH